MSTRNAVSTNLSLPPAPTTASTTGLYHKANVLASVQDAYWSDDETEDNECPLCLEEMDLSDMNFKPCPCGYQICRFCWHHIKTNLNGKCPACRREYTEEAVEFKPVGKEEQKRLAQKKRQKEKERRDLEALGRRHLTNVRIVQRNMIYVTGIGPRFAKEELLPTLRSSEYFGQYGKITKILLVKRTPPSNSASRDPVVGLYINYYRREDAVRAIAAVDGASSPSGGGEVMRASYGTTKYCVNFLRGVACTSQGCLDLHDWGDERDCFTKEDLSTLKHTLKDGEHRPRPPTTVTGASRKSEDAEQPAGLPKTASWARPGSVVPPVSPIGVTSSGLQSSRQSAQRPPVRVRDAPPVSRPVPISSVSPKPVVTTAPDKRLPIGTVRAVEATSSAPTAAVEPTPSLPKPSVPPNLGTPPPGIPTVVPLAKPASSKPSRPPALSTPSVAPPPSRPPGIEPPSTSGIVASTSSYRMTNQGKALLDDVLNLRETAPAEPLSPFPEFDRTLMNLQRGSFSFSLDLKSSAAMRLADNRSTSDWSGPGSPTVAKFGNTPINIPFGSGELEHMASPVYSGSFNPFDPAKDDRPSSQGRSGPSSRAQSPADDEIRRSSRFGFARRPGGGLGTPGSSYRVVPSLTSSPTKFSETLATSSPGVSSSVLLPLQQPAPPQNPANNWSFGEYPADTRPSEWRYANHDVHEALSPQAEARAFKSLDVDSDAYGRQDQISDNAMLHKVLNIGGSVPLGHSPHLDTVRATHTYNSQQFQDPAIMSMHPNAPFQVSSRSVLSAGPPPGLAGPTPNFQTDQASVFTGSSRSGRMPVGSSGSSRIGAGSPSFNSAMSVSNAGDGEGASVSAEGNLPDVESNLESQSVSVVASALSSPVPPARLLEAPPTQPTFPATVELPLVSEVEVPALTDADFPALPTNQPFVPSRAPNKRSATPKRVVEPRETPPSLGKTLLMTKSVAATAQKTAQVMNTMTSMEPVVGRARSVSSKKESRDNKPTSVSTVPLSPVTTSVEKAGSSRRPVSHTAALQPEPVIVAPFTSRKTKKVKASPVIKAPKKPYKETTQPVEDPETAELGQPTETIDNGTMSSDLDIAATGATLTSISEEVRPSPASLAKMLNEVGRYLDVEGLAFFDTATVNTKGQSNIRYAPLVHALSTLSAGTTFTGSMPNTSIDSAVSSFQQLLETLTQTISDILHLLPRNTWDDSSSFDGLLREMLRAEDLLDDVQENAEIRDDEVANLTIALEKRARWMEHQLTKLEDLHRDINSAAVRAVLSMNDRGWDPTGSLPRQGDSLSRFDGMVYVCTEEIEEALAASKAAEAAAEAELKQTMHRNCAQLW
ncbi:hypothetical protein DACRYDRAFT_20146 [Dacryopinax primogenitus]|uniref:RING-type domain-containing protein n=1 Tax=Dacryopinax primogenitus (strain DJM 731) TaxID=1858805 RepID=M5GEW9_DACPD|nr:uncharacterized protein DACRYDRAFT_20146 [Dacryopinax primogenitus]EJU05762.1 hypothetical protein DACRYDRAFT_20146 [Dacryopinax primogenitus]